MRKNKDSLFHNKAFERNPEVYLQSLLRLEKDDAPNTLRNHVIVESEEGEASLSPDFIDQVKETKDLLAAYKAFFTNYLRVHEQNNISVMAGYKLTKIETLQKATPHKGNALGIFEATVTYLSHYVFMAAYNNSYDWETLKRLSLKGKNDRPGIGSTQEAAGPAVMERYFHGHSMQEIEAIKDKFHLRHRLETGLGSKFFLIIFENDGVAAVEWIEAAHEGISAILASNALSLIKVIDLTLDMALEPKLSSDEKLPAQLS